MADDIQDEDLSDEDALDNDLYVNGGSFMKETSNLFNVDNDEVQHMRKKLRRKFLKQYRQAEILALREARNNIRNIRVQTGNPREQIELADELAEIALKNGKRDVWYHMSQFIDRKIAFVRRKGDGVEQRIYETLRDLTDPVRTAVLQAYKNFRKFYNMDPLSEEDSMNLMYLKFSTIDWNLGNLSEWRNDLGFLGDDREVPWPYRLIHHDVQIPDPITGKQGCFWQLDLPLDPALVGNHEIVNSYDFLGRGRIIPVWTNSFARLYVESKAASSFGTYGLFIFNFPISDVFNKP